MAERLGYLSAVMVNLGGRYQGRGLTQEGQFHYRNFLDKVIAGEKQSLSGNIAVLTGYQLSYLGQDCLDQLTNGGLVLPNYLNQGPLRGFWHTLMTSWAIKQATGQEVRWAQSWGSNRLVAMVHTAIAESVNGIVVGTPGKLAQGTLDIMHSLSQGEIVALYPEGQPSKTLRPATRGAGRIIFHAASRGKTITTVSCSFDKQNLNVSFRNHTPEQVLSATDPGEYVMREIAFGLSEAA